MEGISLKNYIEQNGKISFEQAVAMLNPVMGSLSNMHSQGLVCGVVSPENIVLCNDGTIYLATLGLESEIEEQTERTFSDQIKAGFSAEEQYRTEGEQGSWTDVYGVSATLYNMLTGMQPMDAMNRVFQDDVEDTLQSEALLTEQQKGVVLKGMALERNNRYQTMEELYAACVKTIDTIAQETEGSNETKEQKKPNQLAFVGSTFLGLITLGCILIAEIAILEKQKILGPIFWVLFFGALTIFVGRFYYPRIDNKKRKPNKFCFVCSLISLVVTFVLAWMAKFNFQSPTAEEGNGELGVALAVISLAFPVFFGYFYFPRLENKKKKRYMKILISAIVLMVLFFVGSIVSKNLNTVSIGKQNIERDVTSAKFTLDLISDHDLEKLKALKKLESLEISYCFIDDESLAIIGELKQLKQLSIAGNTGITDVTPLSKLTNLTYLDISNTKTKDISCLKELKKLQTLNISNTKIENVSVIGNYTQLDTLYMNSLENLDASTIVLPGALNTLYCNGNKLESLEFLKDVKALVNLYAEKNKIRDLKPLANYELNIVELSENKIQDISPLTVNTISVLDLSKNEIENISSLKGITAFELNLSDNQITNIKALKENYRIGNVDLSNNQIRNINALKNNSKIFRLNISNNRISDISILGTLEKLYILEARGNQIEDISVLESCNLLREEGQRIDFRENKISDISALKDYNKTAHIYLDDNKIEDIAPLETCVALEMLTLNNNKISDITPLNSLTKLRILEVVNNPIKSLTGLQLNTKEERGALRVSYDESIDYAPFTQVDNLTLVIYDVPEKEQESLREMGVNSFPTAEQLKEEKEESEKEAGTEDNNG